MANICDFTMKLRGERSAVETLISWLQADYHYVVDSERKVSLNEINPELNKKLIYKKDGCTLYTTAERHFRRVFEYYGEQFTEEEDGSCTYVGRGCCAWSCYDCMFTGVPTDKDNATLNLRKMVSDEIGDHFALYAEHVITLPEACKTLRVSAELYSHEPGCQIAEYFLVDDSGDVVINEIYEYSEVWFDDECGTREEAEEFIGRPLTDEEWDNGYVVECDIDPENPDWEI